MAANLSLHTPINVYQTVSGNTDLTMSIAELASQTFQKGAPVQIAASGYMQVWDGTSGLGGTGIAPGVGIAGIALFTGQNLGSNGAGAPALPFGSVGFPGALYTVANVPFESSAVSIWRGAPFTDGRTLFTSAVPDVYFIGQADNSAGSVPADYTPVITDVGKEFGLTVDSNGWWYVDRGKSTVGTNTCVIIRGLDPNTVGVVNGNYIFQFKTNVTQFGH